MIYTYHLRILNKTLSIDLPKPLKFTNIILNRHAQTLIADAAYRIKRPLFFYIRPN